MSIKEASSKLSTEELHQLWELYQQQQDVDAREKLIIHYAYLVKYAVSRLMINLPNNLDYDDLLSYGMIGLIQSLDKFDMARNIKFETFAMSRIRGAILDELRAQDWMPRSLRKKAKDIERAIKKVEDEHGQSATEQQIADTLQISVEELHHSLSETSFLVLSLDYILSQDSQQGATLEDTIADDRDKTPAELLEVKSLQEALIKALEGLPERERLLITLYYYEGLTMKEIGRILGVTEARVCQLHSQAIHRMRSRLSDYIG